MTAAYEVGDSDVSKQIAALRKSGADTLLIAATPKYATQALTAVGQLLWKVPTYLTSVSASRDVMLVASPQITEFRNGKALAAFVGLCPREFRSGSSVSTSWLSKTGNSHVRRVLYMPAITAMRCKPDPRGLFRPAPRQR